MKLNNENTTETESIGDVKVTKGRMGDNSFSLFMDMIGNQVYSNPIGSIVRELTSNLYDAHIKLEKVTGVPVTEPIRVRYSESEGTGFISFIDKGIGLSPDALQNIYMAILESDKRGSDDEIGGFGMGSINNFIFNCKN